MNRKVIFVLAVIIILLGTLTIAKSYKESNYENLKEFFLSKLSPEEKAEFEAFSELDITEKIQIIKQHQNRGDYNG